VKCHLSTAWIRATTCTFLAARAKVTCSVRSASVATGLDWQQHPATYVITLQDKQFPIALQREFASPVGTVVEVDAGHAPMLTIPAVIAETIAAAAT